MKMLFALETRRLLGVHIVGEGATELIHIGQAVLNLEGTLDYFVENTFNYPTLAEAYKIAALDAWNRMPARDPDRPFRRSVRRGKGGARPETPAGDRRGPGGRRRRWSRARPWGRAA